MSANLPNVTALFSGRGSNLRSLFVQAKNYQITHIVTDNPEAQGLSLASEYGIRASVVDRKKFASKSEFKQKVFEVVRNSNPQFVCLAGYMQILHAEFVDHFHGRLLNIHPSLLPNFPGLHTHERAIQAKSKQHGCTVHFVDSGVDTGPIIAQIEVPIYSDDSAESLSERVLAKEHLLYPWVLNLLANADITLKNGKVLYSSGAVENARDLNIIIGR